RTAGDRRAYVVMCPPKNGVVLHPRRERCRGASCICATFRLRTEEGAYGRWCVPAVRRRREWSRGTRRRPRRARLPWLGGAPLPSGRRPRHGVGDDRRGLGGRGRGGARCRG